MANKTQLKIDWASHKAAKYAVEHWHYSKTMPVGKLVKVGAWEDGVFIGVVMFGRGATPNLGKPYGLQQIECVELVRIALRKHETPVSKIMAISINMLKRANNGIRLVISFADPSQNHHGGIYQAGNWIYTGEGSPAKFYRIHNKLTHPRSIGAAGFTQNIKGARAIDKRATVIEQPGKHRYLMPLDKETRSRVCLLSRPYPKRVKRSSDAADFQLAQGGAIPTHTLQYQEPNANSSA